MGMYTEFHLNVELREDCPDDVLDILRAMTGDGFMPSELPEHPLLATPRWRWMLKSDSYYFAADTHSTLRHDKQGGWYLCIRCNLKNYRDEIEHFLNFLSPYVDGRHEGEFVGFSRYEESADPTLIYYRDGTLQARAIA